MHVDIQWMLALNTQPTIPGAPKQTQHICACGFAPVLQKHQEDINKYLFHPSLFYTHSTHNFYRRWGILGKLQVTLQGTYNPAGFIQQD